MEEKLTTLASLPYSKAEILSSILETEGIDSFLEKVDFLQNGMDTGVNVRINEMDIRKAFPILEKMLGKETGIPSNGKIMCWSRLIFQVIRSRLPWLLSTLPKR